MRSLSAIALPGAALLYTLSLPISAAGVAGFAPLQLDARLEHDIERLLAAADQPIVRRPVPLSVIQAALPAACDADADLCRRVQRGLAPWLGRAALGTAALEAGLGSEAALSRPNQRGASIAEPWHAQAAGYAQFGQHLRMNLGAVAHQSEVDPAGSYLSAGFDWAQIDVGYRERWWSPLADSAMLLSTQASSLPSIAISNPRALTPLKINVEMFAARLSRSDFIAFQGRRVSGNPRVFGFSLSLQPLPGLALGANRVMQFGGGDRPQSAKDIFNAFFNAFGYDNSRVGLSSDQEFGNQQVSLTAQLTVPGPKPLVVSMEYAGEDTFHNENFRYGNGALSAGLFLPRLSEHTQLRFEVSNWEDVWYTHHVYGDGLTNEGRVLGHWGADWRAPHETVGGQSHLLQLNWQRSSGTDYEFRYRTALNESYGTRRYRRAHALSVSAERPWRMYAVGGRVDFGRDMYGDSFARLAATLRVSGDARNWAAQFVGASAQPRAHGPRVERFIDFGIAAGRLRYEQDKERIALRSSNEQGAQLGLGVRRSIFAHSDLGMRLEVSRLAGHALYALRALDYRRRFGAHFAAGGFLGFAHYDAATAAHGYYAGMGAQWRDLLPGWDVNFDVRYLDRLSRKKVLVGEPIILWPNEYWTSTGVALYLSRRF